MDTRYLKRIKEGIIENTDNEGYHDYIVKRNMAREINRLHERINIQGAQLSEIKQLLQQLVKAN